MTCLLGNSGRNYELFQIEKSTLLAQEKKQCFLLTEVALSETGIL